jgi:endonuclease VIII
MPLADIGRTASAMRTALVGHPMVRFDAPKLIGPVPQAGRTIELVETHGKHLEVTWDDGLVLDTHLKGSSEWHVYRPNSPWRRSWDQLRASIETDDWVAVCFNSPNIETYRQPDPGRHPGRGRLGPDLAEPAADLEEAIELLLSHPEPDARLRDVLLDQHVMVGVGNVYRSEVLWATELSPWAHVGDLSQADAVMIVNTTAHMLRAGRSRSHRERESRGPAVFGRNGQGCLRCHETIESRTVGRAGRMLYWCPGCQVRLDRHLMDSVVIPREMDPHPAAARYLSDLPWRTRDAS